MKLAYSPGPWHVARYGTPQGKKQTIIQGVASNVCRMDISGRLQQTLDDDALLIAAAPDLLAVAVEVDELLAKWRLEGFLNYGKMESGYDKELERIELKLDEALYAAGIKRDGF